MNGITKETWLKASPETKEEILFDYLSAIHNRVNALESRKWLHASLQTVGGMVGGAIVVFCYLEMFAG